MDKIQSLREAVGKDYTKPDPSKLKEFQEALKEAPHALDYLKTDRGLLDEAIEHFQLGYSKYYDAIAIPIFKNDELINFKYRYLNPTDFKYTSEAGAETWIYNDQGIIEGLRKGSILIVEGEFDLMSAWQNGIKHVVSPASGKDSYGVWIAKIDEIPKVYIAYDNDEGGQETSLKIAERLGLDKCMEVKYPEGYKDANDFFKENSIDDFKGLIKQSSPYYSHKFKGLGDIIHTLRNQQEIIVRSKFLPKIDIEKDWLLIASGRSNVGKTSWALNVADDLSKQDIPTLILPFERGIQSVGKRFLQVKFDKTLHDFKDLNNDEWENLTRECIDTPIYFSLPNKNEIIDIIIKSRRLFDTRFVIIDHLDYIVRNNTTNRENDIAKSLQSLKRVAEENGVIILIITHIRKIDSAGHDSDRKPSMEDLKGSSSLYQDPESVIMLSSPEEGEVLVDIVKNKGEMGECLFTFNNATGVLSEHTWESF